MGPRCFLQQGEFSTCALFLTSGGRGRARARARACIETHMRGARGFVLGQQTTTTYIRMPFFLFGFWRRAFLRPRGTKRAGRHLDAVPAFAAPRSLLRAGWELSSRGSTLQYTHHSRPVLPNPQPFLLRKKKKQVGASAADRAPARAALFCPHPLSLAPWFRARGRLPSPCAGIYTFQPLITPTQKKAAASHLAVAFLSAFFGPLKKKKQRSPAPSPLCVCGCFVEFGC